jgi:hypothetical protein
MRSEGLWSKVFSALCRLFSRTGSAYYWYSSANSYLLATFVPFRQIQCGLCVKVSERHLDGSMKVPGILMMRHICYNTNLDEISARHDARQYCGTLNSGLWTDVALFLFVLLPLSALWKQCSRSILPWWFWWLVPWSQLLRDSRRHSIPHPFLWQFVPHICRLG